MYNFYRIWACEVWLTVRSELSEYGLHTGGSTDANVPGASNSIKPTDPFSEDVVKEIINLGFSREDVSYLLEIIRKLFAKFSRNHAQKFRLQ